MNLQMMEGLLGASSNIQLSGTPMRVYRQANAEDDTETMKRTLGYTGECAEKAVRYQEKLDKDRKAEAKAEREKATPEQEAAIEARREERKQTAEPIDGEPVIYTPSGEVAAAPEEAEPTVSFAA